MARFDMVSRGHILIVALVTNFTPADRRSAIIIEYSVHICAYIDLLINNVSSNPLTVQHSIILKAVAICRLLELNDEKDVDAGRIGCLMRQVAYSTAGMLSQILHPTSIPTCNMLVEVNRNVIFMTEAATAIEATVSRL